VAANKIGAIGDGNVGSALARGLKRAGHEVRAVGKDKTAIRETASWAEVAAKVTTVDRYPAHDVTFPTHRRCEPGHLRRPR
jgi:3-hydroxyisobutyrate dehydrogenase-like beta-hydroxyacid dehydrogenase